MPTITLTQEEPEESKEQIEKKAAQRKAEAEKAEAALKQAESDSIFDRSLDILEAAEKASEAAAATKTEKAKSSNASASQSSSQPRVFAGTVPAVTHNQIAPVSASAPAAVMHNQVAPVPAPAPVAVTLAPLASSKEIEDVFFKLRAGNEAICPGDKFIVRNYMFILLARKYKDDMYFLKKSIFHTINSPELEDIQFRDIIEFLTKRTKYTDSGNPLAMLHPDNVPPMSRLIHLLRKPADDKTNAEILNALIAFVSQSSYQSQAFTNVAGAVATAKQNTAKQNQAVSATVAVASAAGTSVTLASASTKDVDDVFYKFEIGQEAVYPRHNFLVRKYMLDVLAREHKEYVDVLKKIISHIINSFGLENIQLRDILPFLMRLTKNTDSENFPLPMFPRDNDPSLSPSTHLLRAVDVKTNADTALVPLASAQESYYRSQTFTNVASAAPTVMQSQAASASVVAASDAMTPAPLVPMYKAHTMSASDNKSNSDKSASASSLQTRTAVTTTAFDCHGQF